MIHSDRIRERMQKLGINQSELARRVNVTQGAIAKIAKNNPNGSSHLHTIARELETTPAYLTGEIDDPDAGAPPPRPKPTAQLATMQVVLPDVRALQAMFRGVLRVCEGMSADDTAYELARLLPRGLGLLQGPLVFEDPASDDADSGSAASGHDDHLVRRRA